VLKVLEEKNISVDTIIGCSMGALIGGAYAAGLSPCQMENIACETNWLRVAKLFLPRHFQQEGLIDGSRIEEFLLALVGEQKIEDLKITFAALATDIWTGEEIMLQSGSLIKAIRASSSFPFLFSPVKIKGRFLVDGGVVNPLPVNFARDLGADIVIAIRTTPTVGRQIRKMNSGQMVTPKQRKAAVSSTSFFNRFIKFINREMYADSFRKTDEKSISIKPGIRQKAIQVATIMENQILSMRLEFSPPDLLISPDIDYYQFMDFTHAGEIIEAGEEATRLALENNSETLKLDHVMEV